MSLSAGQVSNSNHLKLSGKFLWQNLFFIIPSFLREFTLTTNAFSFAIGSVLSQGEISNYLPLGYASCTLNSAEQNYRTTEKELLANVSSIRHLKPYLEGTTFTIATDHKLFTRLSSCIDPGSRFVSNYGFLNTITR